ALAQEWPTRVVRFIVPFAPGAGADIGARLAADKLSRRWPQAVIVENRPGGDSLIGIKAVVGANDDHMLLFSPAGNFTPHPYRYEKRGYERTTDLLPIARFSNTVLGFAVASSLGTNTLKEWVDKAKASPGKMNVVLVPGITEFVWDGFAKSVGIDVVKVPYTNLVQGANDMGTERVQGSMASLAILQPAMQGNVAKLLVVTGRQRVSILPDTPTAIEAGFPSMELEGLVGVFGPKGMSLELRRKIGKDIVEVASEPDIASRLVATGQVPNPGGADEFTAAIERQEAQVAEIAKLMGLPRKD
ncbi:MAG: transporter substrate-binding protein, partial [Hyphomicrobiales bacterium]|nr:transporter substrate-binding protein [Hyphomicrobiales bacterium]